MSAVDALGLEHFHLVVHDLGGPVGFELAAAAPDRVKSLTVLNTIVDVDTFKRPWAMEPFARRGVGELYLRALSKLEAEAALDAPVGHPPGAVVGLPAVGVGADEELSRSV